MARRPYDGKRCLRMTTALTGIDKITVSDTVLASHAGNRIDSDTTNCADSPDALQGGGNSSPRKDQLGDATNFGDIPFAAVGRDASGADEEIVDCLNAISDRSCSTNRNHADHLLAQIRNPTVTREPDGNLLFANYVDYPDGPQNDDFINYIRVDLSNPDSVGNLPIILTDSKMLDTMLGPDGVTRLLYLDANLDLALFDTSLHGVIWLVNLDGAGVPRAAD